ncbi:hypothetical protein COO91_08886 [Nostoc flagelliforme CCNUN1]|uniref:Uncharacterized protein n=1 Tax=Nostoc flagelliforme CCNUN1 TaxID=2038116 RepID=A0A2K8T538_9NOSO|nr:hypothetical protein COO91_08886 [Nostoc flagelliforme CCNUN1]
MLLLLTLIENGTTAALTLKAGKWALLLKFGSYYQNTNL